MVLLASNLTLVSLGWHYSVRQHHVPLKGSWEESVSQESVSLPASGFSTSFLHLQNQQQEIRASYIILLWPLLLTPSSASKDPCNHTGPTQAIQNNPFKVIWFSNLNSTCNSLLSYNTYSEVLGTRMWTLSGFWDLPPITHNAKVSCRNITLSPIQYEKDYSPLLY